MKTIEQLRKEHDPPLTQLELSRLLDVTPVTIWGWEARRHEPNVSQLRKIAAYFGVSMDDIETDPINKVKEAA